MKKFLLILAVLFGLIISGCTTEEMSDVKPPDVYIKIGKERYETKLGTYCWKGTCADTKAGPVELLKGKVPIRINPGEKVTIIMDHEPKPNKIQVKQINNDKEDEIIVNENRFTAPTQEGIYYYSYSVGWMDEEEEHLSHGDAFYAFVLEVK
ncbi:hypothetical protein V7654_12845 [Bacillus sp. JJ1609]|uniref:hypothetical protein n=1 Tax=Bacillus sp. JJ1609 TaxID=3122977 RepID=UPI002FFDFC6E